MPGDREILRTEGLWKRYGEITAVADMNLRVYEREVFSFLGPNGAGKSTTVGMILGLVRPTHGRALVLGHDMATHPWPTLKRRCRDRNAGLLPIPLWLREPEDARVDAA